MTMRHRGSRGKLCDNICDTLMIGASRTLLIKIILNELFLQNNIDISYLADVLWRPNF